MKKTFKISKSNQKLIKSIADRYFGGHFTVLSFTTCYSFMFGTPSGRENIDGLKSFHDINDAISDAIQKLIINTKDVDYGRK